MSRYKKLFPVLAFVVCLCVLILPGVSAAKEQTQCPVMGGLVNKNVYADYQGSRVYFCCPPCVKEFKKNPDLYVKKLKDQGFALAKSPESGS